VGPAGSDVLIYRPVRAELKQAAYQPDLCRHELQPPRARPPDTPSHPAVDEQPGNSQVARQGRKFTGLKLADYLAGRRIDLLNDLIVRGGIHPILVRSPGIVEKLVQVRDQGLQ